MTLLWIFLAGSAVGYGTRLAVPYLLRLEDRAKPFRFPWFEPLCGLVWVLLARDPELSAHPWPWLLLAQLLLAIAACDIYKKLVPDTLTVLGAGLGVVLSAVFPGPIRGFLGQNEVLDYLPFAIGNHHVQGLTLSLLGAAAGLIFLELIRRGFGALAQAEVMGQGDAFILMMIGAFIGPYMAVFAVAPACVLGIVGGLVHLKLYGQAHSPFGPSLGLGGLLMLTEGTRLLRAIEDFQSALREMSPGMLAGIMLGLLVLLVLLLVRLRRKAAAYSEEIEREYAETEKQMRRSKDKDA